MARPAMAMLDQAVSLDLLLSDVGLPGPNGRQVADYARANACPASGCC